MKCRVQVILETEAGEQVQEVACLERSSTKLEEMGLTLSEAKSLLANVQKVVVAQQAAEYIAAHQQCSGCGKMLLHKGRHAIVFRTLFGNLRLTSPRLYHCPCYPAKTRSFSPLSALLTEHTAPERLYLETKWASVVSFATTAQLLGEVLPLEEQVHASSIHHHLHRVAQRSEAALGDEQVSFIDGCPREWAALPRPSAPLTVGIDGGFVRDWQDKQKHFEIITGKSMPEDGLHKCFGFVQTYDQKPKRRLFELLKSQGMQFNQQVVFLSDGGDDVRDLQLYLHPDAEHLLDWFHVTMRLTVMGQYAKGLPEKVGEGEEQYELRDEIEKRLERIKHFLWHGNVFRAVQEIEEVEMALSRAEEGSESGRKLAKAMEEFRAYVEANQRFIPNYGERWRNQETISSGFVESTVNEVISKRMVKKQQMQWTKRGAHLLLQTRTKMLNGELEQTFRAWYPSFRALRSTGQKVA